ncbi:MerR family transcriptional regulator [Bacillus pseudomycoides]|uniref:MerR family transcriptional regulator n=1 Tax=Bacillus pseudomycoides TaxID=64104 RepID=UPI0001A14EDB|nr:MerR family transcriptional regulator [Bacillus pseudomycoides]EEM10509.1 Transcriptional regulator, MerR [Bacillus pseudomycoides]KFN14164.1 merR regulatory family protein [Bacillus pseudomycoides]MDR4190326.1 MerR family transcriptional regulator [Bacillus pseudomycoides]MED0857797.1 MerR family transcriptional regulator [Bacillus pseudomycoides]PDZ71380.1 MerR family transcriptional regulator [Bacillus pseudomycoides]
MYTVGQFSTICGVSIKTLHHYDAIHLVKPLHTDSVTGYRYYDYEQIKTLQYIKKLKMFGFSLQEIKRVLESHDNRELENRLREKALQLEGKMIKMRQTLEAMDQSIDDLNRNEPFVTVSNITECFEEIRERQWIYGVREKICIREIDFVVKKLFERLYAYGIEVDGKMMTVFHQFYKGNAPIDLEVCVPIKECDDTLSNVRCLEGGKHICVIVKGPYSELGIAYEKIMNFIEEKGYVVRDSPFEVYEQGVFTEQIDYKNIRPASKHNPLQFITKVCFPVYS